MTAIKRLEMHSSVGERMTRCPHNPEKTVTSPKKYRVTLERPK